MKKEPQGAGHAEGSIEVSIDAELREALNRAEQQIERLLVRCETLDFIAVMFGQRENGDEALVNYLAEIVERLNQPAVNADDRSEIERQAGTNDPRLIAKWIEEHKAK